jgi:RNA polymerase sigma-70 factor (ECF subfamily)
MVHLEDKILVRRLKSGDKNAFKLLFEKYYPLFISFAQRLLKDEIEAEDLIQDVFMRVWVGRANLNEDKHFKNYLLVSIRNEIFQHFRHAFRTESGGQFLEIIDDGINLETELSAKELEQRVSVIVSRMPHRRREIFNLSRCDKLSNQEIAQRLGISVRTVEKHIEQALSDIRKNISISILVLILSLW